MNSPLGRILVGLLKLVLRLIVLAITGKWVELEKSEQTLPAPTQKPVFDVKAPNRAALAQQLEMLRARQSPATASERAELETFTREVGAPFESYLRQEGVGLRRRTFVVLMGSDSNTASLLPELRANTRHWPIVIPERAGGLEPYVIGARERARALAEDAPGLLQRLRRANGWPEFLLLPGSDPQLSPEHVAQLGGAFGVWLPTLLAEILLTLQLGPGYVAYLMGTSELAPPGGQSNPRLLGDQPPRLARIQAALGTLEFLGHFEESERIERALEKRFGEEPSLPLRDERASEGPQLPYALWRGELDGLLESTLEDVQPALGGHSLLDAPGVPFLHGEHARAQRLAALLEDRNADLRAHRASARDWLAAALLVREEGGMSEAELGLRLRHALGGERRPSPRAVAAPLAAARTAPPGPARLDALLRDPAAIRDAVTLGALLGPRRHR